MGLFPNDNLCTFWDGGFPHGDFQTPSRHGFLVISTPGAQPQKFHWHWLLAMAAKGMKQWTKLRQWIPNQNLLLVICINIYIYILYEYTIYIYLCIYIRTHDINTCYTHILSMYLSRNIIIMCVYMSLPWCHDCIVLPFYLTYFVWGGWHWEGWAPRFLGCVYLIKMKGP